MLNIPKDTIFNHQEIYQLCFDRYMFRTMFEGCYPNNPESFEETLEKRTKKANIFAVQNTKDWFYNQSQIKDW